VTGNWIWKEMTIEVGKVMKQQALDYSFTVVTLRGVGLLGI
jgi:NADH:ubiquinone oxidoreductase subunit D